MARLKLEHHIEEDKIHTHPQNVKLYKINWRIKIDFSIHK